MTKPEPSPLAGKRVVITRAASQSEGLRDALAERGAIPIVRPLIAFSDPEDFSPLDMAILQLGQFDWLIFTSGEAVRAVVRRSGKLGKNVAQRGKDLRVAAVGPVTADAVKQAGLPVDYLAKMHSGVALANELGEKVRGKKVLLPRSDRANPDLPEALKRYGAEVKEVIAYRTIKPADTDKERLRRFANDQADAILFFSPSAVLHFVEAFGREGLCALEDKLAVTAVGLVTGGALQEAGVRRIVTARDTTEAAVVEALEEHFAATKQRSIAGVKQG